MMITAWRKSAVCAARIAQPPVVEHLQEQVPDARVGLLELVEQHDRERLAADPGHERRVGSGLVGRRASGARCRGSGTRDRSSRIIRSPEPNRYSASALAISVLPVPGRADEQQHGLRPRRVGQPRLEQRDALDHALDRLRLADHAARRRTRAARRRRAARARRAAPAACPERSETVASTSSTVVAAVAPRAGASPPAARARAPGSAPAEEVAAERERLAQRRRARAPPARASASVRGSSRRLRRARRRTPSRTAGRSRTSRS